MVKVRVNMKNGDKWMIKLDVSPNESINNVLKEHFLKDYNNNFLNITTYDLLECKENTSIAIIVNDISSIEYGF
jgi:hypothetical protein